MNQAGSYGRKNIYTCEKCGGITVTIDVDEGVTPFMLRCRASSNEADCDGYAQSSMYRVPQGPSPEPKWEWFRPTGIEYRKLSREMRDHVDKGGLDLRKIQSGVEKLDDAPKGYWRDKHGSLRRVS